MKKSIYSSLIVVAALTYFTGCGGGGSSVDPTVPKSVIKDLPNDFTVVQGSTIKLDGSLSSDDVKIVKYSWMIDDTIVSDKVTEEIDVTLAVGKHKLCLITEDADGKSGKTCKDFNVKEPNTKTPTAVINNIPSSGWKTKCKITLDAQASTAIFKRTIKSYKWYKDAAEIGTDINQTFSFDTTGEHNISLEVTDDAGESDKVTRTVQIAQIGHPTAKLTLVNVFNQQIFSGESNENNKVWEISANNPYAPYKSNYVFLSAAGSHDDCDLTDDNLSFKWEASIYDADEVNTAPSGINGIKSCFHNKGELKDRIMDFNGTQIVGIDIKDIEARKIAPSDPDYDPRVKRNPNGTYYLEGIDLNKTYKYPYVEVIDGTVGGGWEGWEGWRNEKWEHAYLSMCAATKDYTHLKITLTVIDHLHDINTTVTKVLETKYTRKVNDQNISIDPNHPNFGQVLDCQAEECQR
jgi:hypothetical protein